MATPSQALFRVFVQPLLSTPLHSALHHGQSASHSLRRQTPHCIAGTTTTVPCRNLNRYTRLSPVAKPRQFSLNDAFILDEKIASQTAHLVSADGKLGELTPLHILLRGIDRTATHLRKVAEHETGAPIVKEVSKASLHEALAAKSKVKETGKTEEDLTKQVELTWAITGNDLKYRLAWAENFLREGRRVEMVVAPKKGGRKATPEEAEAVLKSVREAVNAVEGTEEWKTMEGRPGGQATLYFRNRVQKVAVEAERKVKAVEGRAEKLERKQREKEEKREKIERRAARKKEAEEVAGVQTQKLLAG